MLRSLRRNRMLPIVPDPPSPLRATLGLLASALALCTVVVVAHGDTRVPEETPRESSPETILSAIERLESQKDAKCYSAASRFEDFLFGTPLSAQARLAHDEEKKLVARRLWTAASRSASKAGDATIEAGHIDREAAAIVVPTQQGDGIAVDGHRALLVTLRLEGQQRVSLAVDGGLAGILA